MTWVRHGYDTGTAPQIIVKIPNHRIRARERERERGNEGRNDANPHGGDVRTEATIEGQVFLAVVLGMAVLVFPHAHERGRRRRRRRRRRNKHLFSFVCEKGVLVFK